MDYEDLPYDELRDMAFDRAQERHDVRFFYDLYRHTPAMTAMADEGGSLGELSGSIIEIVEGAREAFGADSVGEWQPMFVAVYATYLREHGEPKKHGEASG